MTEDDDLLQDANRADSVDSRRFGTVPMQDVLGRRDRSGSRSAATACAGIAWARCSNDRPRADTRAHAVAAYAKAERTGVDGKPSPIVCRDGDPGMTEAARADGR